MPHVRSQEYSKASDEYQLKYVEVIHRHHKRTPYAANTFPEEGYAWYCDDEGLFHYGQPLPIGNLSQQLYWKVFTSSSNPFRPTGFNGTCQFPQITREGLDDSWQHGKDLFGVYHDLLQFLPDNIDDRISYRVTNNVITSQVAGMVINAMYGRDSPYGVNIQPDSIDSLEPTYACPAASDLFSSVGVGSTNPSWTAHLTASQALYERLDGISGVSPTDSAFHQSADHYFDNLSSRLCHQKPLPCNVSRPKDCIALKDAEEIFRLGQYEYSYIYRDTSESLKASVGSYGVWVAELAQNIRDAIAGTRSTIYRHNVAHDGSISRLLSILQVDAMVWPGMGAEVVFEVYGKDSADFVRILWGGQVLRSSNPAIGQADMLPVEIVLAYFDGLVGVGASSVLSFCKS
ncbi:MAG: mannosyl-oligosaccharide alpha-1,2-mannosidase [Chaenotheca gracillima]|nr:MAG: mannosyl-oligosaccharide alpha-1,2-mannosidase [Chaenotheca gracillima]